ncbi:MAG: SRPBCC family protein [Planctomycetota bacterium]|jgi:ligand-binding SRPBCC domain-containing protein
MPRLVREQFFARPRPEIFAFFADASNLARITPDFLHFTILTPMPLEVGAGALIDYRLRLFGIPFRWRTRIEAFEPPERFSDIQALGPYRSWHHLHEFEERDGGTLMRDTVDYELPLGPLGAVAHALFVRRSVARIFDHRREVLAREFG